MIHVERLNHLITILEAVNEQESEYVNQVFDMSFYLGKDSKSPCGFAGCAIGHAAMDPVFNEQGFRATGEFAREVEYIHANYVGETDSTANASRHFFGLNDGQYYFLFEPNYYKQEINDCSWKFVPNIPEKLFVDVEEEISPLAVIRRIRFLLANPH